MKISLNSFSEKYLFSNQFFNNWKQYLLTKKYPLITSNNIWRKKCGRIQFLFCGESPHFWVCSWQRITDASRGASFLFHLETTTNFVLPKQVLDLLSLVAIKMESRMCRPHKHEDGPMYRQILPRVKGIRHFYHHCFVIGSQHINTYCSIVAA
jgi:hypothetical protein